MKNENMKNANSYNKNNFFLLFLFIRSIEFLLNKIISIQIDSVKIIYEKAFYRTMIILMKLIWKNE